jgi:hypothetical protein
MSIASNVNLTGLALNPLTASSKPDLHWIHWLQVQTRTCSESTGCKFRTTLALNPLTTSSKLDLQWIHWLQVQNSTYIESLYYKFIRQSHKPRWVMLENTEYTWPVRQEVTEYSWYGCHIMRGLLSSEWPINWPNWYPNVRSWDLKQLLACPWVLPREWAGTRQTR